MRCQAWLLALFIAATPSGSPAKARNNSSGPDSHAVSSEVSTRFQRVRICLKAKQLKSFFDAQEKDQNLEATLADIEPPVRKVRARNREIARSADSLCSGLGAELEDRNVYALALDAARFGNTEAARCYIYAAFPMSDAMHDDPRLLEAYQQNAAMLIESEIRRGDWRIIDILLRIAGGNVGVDYMDPSWRYTLSARVPPGPTHPLTTRVPDYASMYRYNRLQRLGASGELATELDRNFDLWATWLPAGVRRTEEAEAEALYRQYFRKSPRRAERTPICDF